MEKNVPDMEVPHTEGRLYTLSDTKLTFENTYPIHELHQDFRPSMVKRSYRAGVAEMSFNNFRNTKKPNHQNHLTLYPLIVHIMITCPCNEHPFTPHFYIVKLQFTRVYIFFLIFALKHRSWVLVRTASRRF